MPQYQLLHFPEELLAQILEELLPPLCKDPPPLFPHDVLRDMPLPLDLYRLSTTCKILQRLTLPLIWRRVSIRIQSEWPPLGGSGTHEVANDDEDDGSIEDGNDEDGSDGNEDDVNLNTEDDSEEDPHMYSQGRIRYNQLGRLRRALLPGQWSYLFSHPEAVSHIRILAVDIRHAHTQAQAHPLPFSLTLATFKILVSSMNNLQVLRLSYNLDDPPELIKQTYTDLISKPRLHTIICRYVPAWPNPWPSHFPRTTNLTHLYFHQWECGHEVLLMAAPRLQSLTMGGLFADLWPVEEDFTGYLETLPVPWGTLRKLALHSVDYWYRLMDNLLAWKKSFPTSSASLSNLYIGDSDQPITSEEIDHLIRTGQDLRTISLQSTRIDDEPLLRKIPEAFPHLQELGLATMLITASWRVDQSTLFDILGKLPRLTRLRWNYTDLVLSDDTQMGEEEELLALRVSFDRVVPAVAVYCPALKRVDFYDKDVWTSYTIERDEVGWYKGYSVIQEEPHKYALRETSWDFWKYDHI